MGKWVPSVRTLRCPLCGVRITPKNRSKDHLVPVSRGGQRHADDNCWIVCKPCNNRKGDRMPNDRELEAFRRVKGLPNMRGLFADLSAEQQAAALAFRGNCNFGETTHLLAPRIHQPD
jgi:hypothetical protein